MQARRAFTLVEMLVATALALFIMVLLTEAFVTGLESFRRLKAIGDLQEKMRSVEVILRRDLSAPHFNDAGFMNPPNTTPGRPSVSEQDLSLPPPGTIGATYFWQPPAKGFFRIWQGSPTASTTYAPGSGATATATVNAATGQISGVTVTAGGTGYPVSVAVTFIGGAGTAAMGTATVTGGAVTGVTVTSAGSGYYTAAPTVLFQGAGGSGASATATVTGGMVTGVTMTSGGSGYPAAGMTVTFTQPQFSPATASATVTGGSVAGITLTNPGNGYASTPSVFITGYGEGTDPDIIGSSRAVDHFLHFTIDLSNPNGQTTGRAVAPDTNRRENVLTAQVPLVPPGSLPDISLLGPLPDFRAPGSYSAQWAEVAYFLRSVPGSLTANGTPLFALYRRQALAFSGSDATTLNTGAAAPPRVLYTVPTNTSAVPQDGVYAEVSCKHDPSTPFPTLTAGSTSPTSFLFFNTPDELTIPERRFGTSPTAGTGGTPILTGVSPPTSYPSFADQLVSGPSQIGDDLLLTDVVSFEIKVLPQTTSGTGAPTMIGTDFVSLYDQSVPGPNNTTLFSKATGPMAFDTWSMLTDASYDYSGWATGTPAAVAVPLKIRILALQIILRVWDARTQTTRQITIVQDMGNQFLP
jgi:Tfp pilus assembly protein PilW